MRILVTNDDGYNAAGIKKLAEVAKLFGEVLVVAPESQCSAMSHRLTISNELYLKKQDIGVEGVEAYSVSGTPADCVRVALDYVWRDGIDYVFSGINNGFNAGYDIAYSGTIGAAMEGLLHGIPAIAYSMDYDGTFEVVNHYIYDITRELLGKKLSRNLIWNVNFPGVSLEDCKGVVWDVEPAQMEYHNDHYDARVLEDGTVGLKLNGSAKNVPEKGSDYDVILKGYVSVGVARSAVMKERIDS